MPQEDPRVEAYITKAAPFAQPILRHLRAVVHAGCPPVVETMKWGMPHFEHRGMLCGMASFKAHCAFGFWRNALVIEGEVEDGMGQFGRITSIKDLPPKKTLLGYVRKAAALNEAGVKPTPRPARGVEVPADFAAALKRNKKAAVVFAKFPSSAQREYVDWITSAKRAETRAQRLATAIEWIAEGKRREWKYEATR